MSKLWRPRSDFGRKIKHKILTGTTSLPPRGTGLGKSLRSKLKSRPIFGQVFHRLTLFRVPPPNRR